MASGLCWPGDADSPVPAAPYFQTAALKFPAIEYRQRVRSLPEFAPISDHNATVFHWIFRMKLGAQATRWAGSVTLVGLLVSGCARSDRATLSAAAQSAAPWVKNLNEPPPSREPANDEAARLRTELSRVR